MTPESAAPHHDHDHGHGGRSHEPPADVSEMFTRTYWDERYTSSTRVWSGNPNQRLVEQVSDLAPGTALDIGCGEGADVVWLARHGWQVTGLDVSAVALGKAAAHAEEQGVGEQTSWHLADLLAGEQVPGGVDLVTAHFFHVPTPDFVPVFTALAAAVRPGGTLLVVGHHPADTGMGLRNDDLARLMYTPEQVTAVLDPADWDVVVAGAPTREQVHEGTSFTVTDTVVRALRRQG